MYPFMFEWKTPANGMAVAGFSGLELVLQVCVTDDHLGLVPSGFGPAVMIILWNLPPARCVTISGHLSYELQLH
jgi:hypothetical protein